MWPSLKLQIHVHHLITTTPVAESSFSSSQFHTWFCCCSDPFKYFCTSHWENFLGKIHINHPVSLYIWKKEFHLPFLPLQGLTVAYKNDLNSGACLGYNYKSLLHDLSYLIKILIKVWAIEAKSQYIIFSTLQFIYFQHLIAFIGIIAFIHKAISSYVLAHNSKNVSIFGIIAMFWTHQAHPTKSSVYVYMWFLFS